MNLYTGGQFFSVSSKYGFRNLYALTTQQESNLGIAQRRNEEKITGYNIEGQEKEGTSWTGKPTKVENILTITKREKWTLGL